MYCGLKKILWFQVHLSTPVRKHTLFFFVNMDGLHVSILVAAALALEISGVNINCTFCCEAELTDARQDVCQIIFVN